MNPIWLTIVVAVLSPSGALVAQWIAGVRASRLAAVERESRRDDRALQNREDSYARFLVAAWVIRPTARVARDSATPEPVLVALRDAGAYVDLHAPEIFDGPLVTVLDTAQRLLALVLSERQTSPVVQEAEREFDDALRVLRAAMRADLRGDQ